MQKSDFKFNLPEELIAKFPAEERTHSRLLCLNGDNGELNEGHFYDVLDLINEGDLLVFNNTRVIPARLYGHKETGGNFELLIERILGEKTALVHLKSSKSPKVGAKLFFDHGFEAIMVARHDSLFELEFCGDKCLIDILNDVGHIPLPPYINRPDLDTDKERYQTVYSKVPGAVAAPTAGLHFDEKQLEDLKAFGVNMAFVTLHVGAGTFQPVREDDIKNHHMHKEFVHLTKEVADAVINTHKAGHRVIAVGTTAVRSLESAATYAKSIGSEDEIVPFSNDTSIFIFPGYSYQVVDCLITNFHLPESTLIMLVSAFAGYSHTMNAYKHAVEDKYKFFSYGDCMFITKDKNASSDLPPSAK